MTPETFKRRVQMSATGLMVLTTIYLLYYAYRSFKRAYRFSFGEPERWQNHWRVEADAVIEMSTRSMYFAVWATVIVLSIAAVIAGLHLLNRCRKGMIFDAGTARAIQWLGGLLVVAMLGDTVFAAVELYLLTLHNPVETLPIQFRYDPTDFKTISLAIVLTLFGWMMRGAMEIEQTNREFV